MSQFRNLVFEGGGVKGIGYVGALKVLEARGILNDITRIGGTSAGAINAVLLACGYTGAEQLKILRKLEFRSFLDDSWGVLRDADRLVNEFGWYKGDFFRDWIAGLIRKKIGSGDATFRQLHAKTGKQLFLVGANLSTGFAEVFSYERTPDDRVVDAVRISMSLPLFFASVRNARRDVYVDGGLMNNYPVKLFDRERYVESQAAARRTNYYDRENKRFLTGANKDRSPYVYNKETLGFRLDSAREIGVFRYGDVPQHTRIDDFFDYAKALFGSLMSVQEGMHLHSDDWQRTVYIDTLGVGTIDFGIDEATRDKLVASGEKCAEDYFRWFDSATGDEAPVNRL